jgi:hypothetical protein
MNEDIHTRESRQNPAEDLTQRLKQLIRETDDPKIREQTEKELKKTDLLRKRL